MISMAVTARDRNLTTVQQALGLRSVFPDARLRLMPGRLSWTGQLQPNDLSRMYTVQITYTRGRYPAVWVLAPELAPNKNGFLPHTYDNGTLCLHDAGQWNATMLIVDTIVPWAAEWLLHYEVWLATGEWSGDGDAGAPLGPLRRTAGTMTPPNVIFQPAPSTPRRHDAGPRTMRPARLDTMTRT